MNERKDKAKALFQQKQYAEAARAYQEIVDSMGEGEEDKDKMLVNIGLCHFRIQNFLRAIESY